MHAIARLANRREHGCTTVSSDPTQHRNHAMTPVFLAMPVMSSSYFRSCQRTRSDASLGALSWAGIAKQRPFTGVSPPAQPCPASPRYRCSIHGMRAG